MNNHRNNTGDSSQQGSQQGQQDQQSSQKRDLRQRSGAFREVSTKDQKSTSNVEEEVELEQERKEAMTERD